MLIEREGQGSMRQDEEFRPRFSDDHLVADSEPGPLQAAFRAYRKAGKAGLSKHLAEVEAEANRKGLSTPTNPDCSTPPPSRNPK
jgi:hypothetical protein